VVAHLAERTRIARELHDVLAHQLSAIAVHSGAARLAASGAATGSGGTAAPAATAPGAAAGHPRVVEALAVIERLSREALAELSHLLGALRCEPEDDPARRPAPTLGALEALLATTRAAGVPVDLEIDGQVRPLSPGVELAAYRIIQEALTNVAKHAPAAPTRVALHYRGDRLGLAVVNGPSGATEASS
jgi:signal transduction histidine kinase